MESLTGAVMNLLGATEVPSFDCQFKFSRNYFKSSRGGSSTIGSVQVLGLEFAINVRSMDVDYQESF